MTTGKTIALTRQTLVGKVMALKHDPLIMSSSQAMGSRLLGAVLRWWICLVLWTCSCLGQLIIHQLGLPVFFTSLLLLYLIMGFPCGTSGKEPTCQCRRRKRTEFHPWVGKILWRRKWQPTLVLWPGKSDVPWTEEPGGLQFMGSQKEWDTTERVSRRTEYRRSVHLQT